MHSQEAIVDLVDQKEFARDPKVGCPICHEMHEPRVIPVRFGMCASIAVCEGCRIAYQTPQPSQEASLAYMNWRWASSDPYVADSARKRRRSETQVDHIRQIVKPGMKLLDFGAGNGSFVNAAREAGWNADGVEQSSSAVARAKEFYGIDLLQALDDETYDVITLWDVVEHLRDLPATLGFLNQHLTPGGTLVVETGNYENWKRLADGDQWGLYLFDHQFYFTPSSLQAALERSGFGEFELLDVNHASPLRPKQLVRHPLKSLQALSAYRQAKKLWPTHFDINVMIAVARKQDSGNAA